MNENYQNLNSFSGFNVPSNQLNSSASNNHPLPAQAPTNLNNSSSTNTTMGPPTPPNPVGFGRGEVVEGSQGGLLAFFVGCGSWENEKKCEQT